MALRRKYWPENAEQIINRNIPNASEFVLLGETLDCGMYSAQYPIGSTYQLVVTYDAKKEVFFVWNAAIQNTIHHLKKTKAIQIRAGREAGKYFEEKNAVDADSIILTYKEVRYYGTSCFEPVIIVGQNALVRFCKTYEQFLCPDPENLRYGHCLFARPGEDVVKIDKKQYEKELVFRQRESITRWERDADFRKRILEKWGRRCIVCGASEVQTLEAAHICAVSYGGSDDPNNGYCLCANHHKMFDAGILNIDIHHGVFSCTDEVNTESPWYINCKNRNFKLYIPTEEQ